MKTFLQAVTGLALAGLASPPALAMAITETEPNTLALFGVGLAALGMRRHVVRTASMARSGRLH